VRRGAAAAPAPAGALCRQFAGFCFELICPLASCLQAGAVAGQSPLARHAAGLPHPVAEHHPRLWRRRRGARRPAHFLRRLPCPGGALLGHHLGTALCSPLLLLSVLDRSSSPRLHILPPLPLSTAPIPFSRAPPPPQGIRDLDLSLDEAQAWPDIACVLGMLRGSLRSLCVTGEGSASELSDGGGAFLYCLRGLTLLDLDNCICGCCSCWQGRCW
jgi:hypothetical protein